MGEGKEGSHNSAHDTWPNPEALWEGSIKDMDPGKHENGGPLM